MLVFFVHPALRAACAREQHVADTIGSTSERSSFYCIDSEVVLTTTTKDMGAKKR